MLSASRRLASSCSFQACRSFSATPQRGEVKTIGVLGLGLMGHGIAQVAAQTGFNVVAVDSNKEQLETGISRIQGSLAKLGSKAKNQGKDSTPYETAFSRITPASSIEAFDKCDLVIEAIVENMDIKRKVYKQLGEITPPSAILASNTSSLIVSHMGEASNRPSQMVGMHFFNPVQLMKLVEVVRTDATTQDVVDQCTAVVKKMGKTPVTAKDTPGFIVNRLLVPYMAQALLLLERGDASKEDIDIGMKLGAGHPMGPITLADYVGLDTSLFILEGWAKDYPNEPSFVVPEILRQKVKAGELGRKSGQGFYKWEGDKVVSA